MKQYLLSVISPWRRPPPPEVAAEDHEGRPRRERGDAKRAGVWVFAGGLHPPSTATVVRVKDGDVLTTDGPFAEGKEHIGGFLIIKAADLDAALEWGRASSRGRRRCRSKCGHSSGRGTECRT